MASVEGVGRRHAPLRRAAWRRIFNRADGRSPLWIELAVVAWLFWLYDVVNASAPLRRGLALRHALDVLALERLLHLDPEFALNHWLAAHHTLALLASYYYFFAHGLVTFGLLAWLWWRNPQLYRRLRAQLVLINLVAFAVFWLYPLAPPRMLPSLGFVDIVGASHAAISWSSGALAHNADQLASMPSLHVAWAIWSALALRQLYPRRGVAVLAVAYPILTATVVIATGNHYLLDVLAGTATTLAAVTLAHALTRAGAIGTFTAAPATNARPASDQKRGGPADLGQTVDLPAGRSPGRTRAEHSACAVQQRDHSVGDA